MEELLALASKASDQAEVFSLDRRRSAVEYENAELHNIESELASGFSLRLIKDGRLGFAYTRNLHDREGFVKNALASLAGGVEAGFDFPKSGSRPGLRTFDGSAERMTSSDLVAEVGRVTAELRSRTRGEISGRARISDETIRIANTRGLRVEVRSSGLDVWAGAIYPGSAAGISNGISLKGMGKMPGELIDGIVELFNGSQREVTPKGGRMKVLFMPDALLALNWRILHGTDAKSVYEGISRVADKVGERILSEKLTLVSEPLEDTRPGARSFDDEGTATARFPIIENGVLRGFYNNLDYAKKLGAAPNGHGYRAGMWGGDPLTLKPVPSTPHLAIEPGDRTFRQLVGMMDRGIILCGALGAHSGNIPNGDYSIGVCPGLYVEKGEILGRVKDAMVAGNAFETLQGIAAVGDTLEPGHGGWFPPILCDGVSVACRD